MEASTHGSAPGQPTEPANPSGVERSISEPSRRCLQLIDALPAEASSLLLRYLPSQIASKLKRDREQAELADDLRLRTADANTIEAFINELRQYRGQRQQAFMAQRRFLSNVPSKQLADRVSWELPGTIGAVLMLLTPAAAADVVACLPASTQQPLLERMAIMRPIPQAAQQMLAATLAQELAQARPTASPEMHAAEIQRRIAG